MKQKNIIAFVLVALVVSPVVIAYNEARYYGKEPLMSSKEEANLQERPFYVKTRTSLIDNYEKTNEQVKSLIYKVTKDGIPEPSDTIKEIEVKTNAEIIDNDTYGIGYSWQNLGDVRTTFTFKTLLLKYNFETRDWEIKQEQLYENVTLDPGMGMGQYIPMDLEPGYYVTGIKIAVDFQDLIDINNNDYETFIVYPLTKGQEKPMPLIKLMDLEADKENSISEEVKAQQILTKTTDKDYKYNNLFATNNKQDNDTLYTKIWKEIREVIGLS